MMTEFQEIADDFCFEIRYNGEMEEKKSKDTAIKNLQVLKECKGKIKEITCLEIQKENA